MDEKELITELHIALNDITTLFCSVNGYDYNAVSMALQALEKSRNAYSLPIGVALAQKITETIEIEDNNHAGE